MYSCLAESGSPLIIFLFHLQGDCCNSNFTRVGKNCINASKEMMNYDQAKRNCSEMGSQVIEFKNGQELSEVSSDFANIIASPPTYFKH